MSSVIPCFEVHQPYRMKHLSDITNGLSKEEFFDRFLNKNLNKFIFDRASKKCYKPTTDILLENVDLFKKEKR